MISLPPLTDLRLALGVFKELCAWKILCIGILGTALLMAGMGAGLWWVLTFSGWCDLGWFTRFEWTRWLFGSLGAVVYLILGWFMFPVIFTAVIGMFLEDLADRIERRHYPDVPLPRQIPVSEQIRAAIRGLLRGLFWNLLALPFYFIPVVNIVVYAVINARLFSREYFQVVALRHLSSADTKTCYRRHRAQLWQEGILLSGLFITPIIQLVAPLLATALTVHRLWRTDTAILRRIPLNPPDKPGFGDGNHE